MVRKSFEPGDLDRKFPGFPASFPGLRQESADSGQDLRNLAVKVEKIAAKFPEAGKSVSLDVPDIPH